MTTVMMVPRRRKDPRLETGTTLSRRVLVAEDDAEMRRIVTTALRGAGYEVREAADGSQLLTQILAQEMAPGAHVDLIVSDIRMPEWNGLLVLEALRDERWGIPVILMTAFGDEPTRVSARELGAVLLDKPFAIDDLLSAVDGALDHGDT